MVHTITQVMNTLAAPNICSATINNVADTAEMMNVNNIAFLNDFFMIVVCMRRSEKLCSGGWGPL